MQGQFQKLDKIRMENCLNRSSVKTMPGIIALKHRTVLYLITQAQLLRWYVLLLCQS